LLVTTFPLILATVSATLGVVGVLAYLRRRARNLTLDVVRQLVEPVVWFTMRFVKRSMARRTSLKAYCRTQARDPANRMLHVPGRWACDLKIESVYVPLTLESVASGTVSSPDAIWDGRASRVRIVGDPGSGKSTFVKHMFLRSAERAMKTGRGPLPIVVELRQLKPPDSDLVDWFLGMMRSKVAEAHGYEMGALFDSMLTGDGILVLLDGLDEVRSDYYEAVAEAIIGVSRRLTNESVRNRLLLTMRTQFHDQVRARFDAHFDATFRVQQFSSADVYTFLTKWPFRGDKLASVNRIYGDLTDRPTLREMCSNPLILAMYVADNEGGDSGAPDTRTAFYNHVTEELLVARRSRQLGVTAKSVLQEQRESVLGPLAFENLTDDTQPANSMPWTRALQLVTESHGCTTPEQAERILLGLCSETGVLAVERPGESLRFIHLTFCEFLAARECIQNRTDGWRELMAIHRRFAGHAATRTRLIEVIPFSLGLLTPVQQSVAMHDVCDLADRSLTGLCFLETRRYDHPAWSEYAEKESTDLINTGESGWDNAFLRRLHLFNVILADENAWQRMHGRPRELPLEEVLARLVRDDRSRLVAIFGSYASFDPPAAFRLARSCHVDLLASHPALLIRSLALPPFLAMVLEQARREPHRLTAWSTILAEGALRQPAVAAQLLDVDVTSIGLDLEIRPMPARSHWFFPRRRRSGGDPAPSTVTRMPALLGPSLLTYAMTVATAGAHPTGDKPYHLRRLEELGVKPLRSRLMFANPDTSMLVGTVPLLLVFGWAVAYVISLFPFDGPPPDMTTPVALAITCAVAVALWYIYSSYCHNVMQIHAYLLRCPGVEMPSYRGTRGQAAARILRVLAPDLRIETLQMFFEPQPSDW
jgi:hypothetical protein